MDNNNDILLEKELKSCPICGKEHEIEKRRRIAKAKIKDLVVSFDEIYYRCTNISDDEDNEYVEKCIKELREYEDRIGKKTGRIVWKNGKISIRNLLNEIAKLS